MYHTEIPQYEEKELPTVDIQFKDKGNCKSIELKSSHQDHIYYTTNGSIPNLSSNHYSKPFEICSSCEIISRVILPNESPGFVSQKNCFIPAVKSIEYITKPHYKYTGEPQALIDGKKGSPGDFYNHWVGFNQSEVELILEPIENKPVQKLVLSVLQQQSSWIFTPQKVEVFISEDGKEYQSIADYSPSVHPATKNDDVRIVDYKLDFQESINTPFIKLKIECLEECPNWHDGAGQHPWLFIDEIILK
jgi:hexosaminidase